MRILFVAHTYLRWPGDRAGAQVHRFAREARARGHEVLVIAPHATGAREGQETIDGIAIERFRYAPDAREVIGYQGAVAKSVGTLGALWILPHYLMKFREAVRRGVAAFRPDIISAHWWAPAALATRGAGVPVAVTCHGSDVRLLGSNAFIRFIARRVLADAAGVSAVSGVMAADLERWAGLRSVAVTRMPVDEAGFTAPTARPDPPIILFAGNLIRAKGIDVILRAAAIVHGTRVPFRLRLVGDGPHRPAFEAQARALGLADVVEWAGPQPHERMPEEFACASLFVLASRGPRGEGLPITIIEALMSGCAVVATPAGGIPELILDEETGLLCRDGDAVHLAAQLERLLTDPALRARLATAGRERALAQHGLRQAMDHFFAFLATCAGQGAS